MSAPTKVLWIFAACLLSNSCEKAKKVASEAKDSVFREIARANLETQKDDSTGGTSSASQPTGTASASYSADQITHIDGTTYASTIAKTNRVVVVDFYADWCPPCRALAPSLQKAAEAHPGVVYVAKVNIDHARDLARSQGVSGIPDVRIFKNGQQVGGFKGFPGEASFMKLIDQHAQGIKPTAAAAIPAAAAPSNSKFAHPTGGKLR